MPPKRKQVVNQGPFYLARRNNAKYPSDVVKPDDPGLTYIRNNITGNHEFLLKLNAASDGTAKKLVYNKHIVTLNVNFNNVFEYDEEAKTLIQLSAEDAHKRIFRSAQKRSSNVAIKKKHLSTQIGSSLSGKVAAGTKISQDIVEMKPVDTIKSSLHTTSQANLSKKERKLIDDIIFPRDSKSDNLLDQLLPSNITNSAHPPFPVSVDKYRVYSIVHSIHEGFVFHVYHGSHLAYNQVLHRCSMLKLVFPRQPNFFILFHGNLLHNGAPSRPEPCGHSFNYAKDCRLFSYITRTGTGESVTEEDSGTTSTVRRSGRTKDGVVYEEHANYVNAQSHKKCPDFENCLKHRSTLKSACDICGSMYKELRRMYPTSDDVVSVDIHNLYVEAKRRTPDHPSNLPMLVGGDLERYGWAVYTGCNAYATTDQYNLSSLRDDIYRLLYNTSEKHWRKISGNRQIYNVSDIDNINVVKIDHIKKFYEDIHVGFIKKIPGFEKATMDERFFIRNQGKVGEQNPHRDYEAKGNEEKGSNLGEMRK